MRLKLLAAATLLFSLGSLPAMCQDSGTQTTSHPSTMSRIRGWFGHKSHGAKGATNAKEDKMKQKALSIPSGSPVSVKTMDGKKAKGTLMGVSNSAVSVRPRDGAAQDIAFDNIKGMKKTRGPVLSVDGSGAPQNEKLDSSLGSIPQGSPVNLKMNDKTKLQGRYQGETGDGVNLQVPQGGSMETRTIPKAQIAGIGVDKPGLFHKPKLQSPELVKKRLAGFPSGSAIDFKTPDGRPVSGKLAGKTDTGFSVQSLEGGNIVTKDYAYDQVASINPPKPSFKQRLPGLGAPSLQSAPQIKTAAMGIPVGSPVTLQMPNGSKTVGRLAGVTNDGLQVQSVQGGNVATQSVAYDQIGSIQQGVPSTGTEKAKKVGKAAATVIVTGIVSGALAKAF